MGHQYHKRDKNYKRRTPGEYADDSALTVQQEMRSSLTEVLDKMSVGISSRFSNITAVSYTHLQLNVTAKHRIP